MPFTKIESARQTTTRSERVFLVGVELQSRKGVDVRELLAELAELAQTAGAEVVSDGIQKMESLNAATFIGKGKADDFSQFCKRNNVDTVILTTNCRPRKAQPRKNFRVQNSGPHGADSRHFCATRADAAKANCKLNSRSCSICCRGSRNLEPLVTSGRRHRHARRRR